MGNRAASWAEVFSRKEQRIEENESTEARTGEDRDLHCAISNSSIFNLTVFSTPRVYVSLLLHFVVGSALLFLNSLQDAPAQSASSTTDSSAFCIDYCDEIFSTTPDLFLGRRCVSAITKLAARQS